ncbi:MAG: hypothetical protein QOD42_1326 [Sphingomonadales bacterium]|jgi:hypothetical protein|nr:hypothetical protein [Sphingomonadales bacterium]
MFECLTIIQFICLAEAESVSFHPSTIISTAEVRLDEAELMIILGTDNLATLDPNRMDRACAGENCVAYYRRCDTQPARIRCTYALFGREQVPAFELSAPDAVRYARAERQIRVASGSGAWVPLAAFDRTRETGWPFCRPGGGRAPRCPEGVH